MLFLARSDGISKKSMRKNHDPGKSRRLTEVTDSGKTLGVTTESKVIGCRWVHTLASPTVMVKASCLVRPSSTYSVFRS